MQRARHGVEDMGKSVLWERRNPYPSCTQAFSEVCKIGQFLELLIRSCVFLEGENAGHGLLSKSPNEDT